ncbi:hypothetical protein B0H19DRAFT_1381054 [Mycena capillaripes]|nr:hypothetical protein B0H19DRAFT_1381054 [Mycena capillaripes]
MSTPGGLPPSSGTTTMIMHALESRVLPALNLAKAAVTGIGVPGVEPVINGVLELGTMVVTMKENKEDLSTLGKSLKRLTAADVSSASDDLKQRVAGLSRNLAPLADECKSLAEKKNIERFFRSKSYKEKILSIRNSIAAHIQEFTFWENISIEKAVEHLVSKVDNVLTSVDDVLTSVDNVLTSVDNVRTREILASLKYVPAQYNGENTPNKCMEGTRVEIIEQILTHSTASPDPSQRLVMLSGTAGSGKSTIAKTVAFVLAEEKSALGASFFFSRDYAERNDIRHVPSTLARQLADYSPTFRHLLVKLLDDDRTGILSTAPNIQFQKLVVELLAKLPQSAAPWVICLDALDECGQDRGQTFLRWLSDSITDIPIHIRFFLTGRPDVPSYLKLDHLRSLMHGIVLDDLDSAVHLDYTE